MKLKDVHKNFKYINPFYWINRKKNKKYILLYLKLKIIILMQ